MSIKRVLIVGGTGYLGQHLLQGLKHIEEPWKSYSIAFTHHSKPPPQALLDFIPHALPFFLDLRTGDGFHVISQHKYLLRAHLSALSTKFLSSCATC
ncbi:hypothetical protein Leryth_026353 [Lithospermum erythrorhizon]|nr:hypothetical protein Leryth_026353 [Lithospermum erythrorhizon]